MKKLMVAVILAFVVAVGVSANQAKADYPKICDSDTVKISGAHNHWVGIGPFKPYPIEQHRWKIVEYPNPEAKYRYTMVEWTRLVRPDEGWNPYKRAWGWEVEEKFERSYYCGKN